MTQASQIDPVLDFLNNAFSSLLAEAERLYGPRDVTIPYLGVIRQSDGPHIWFSSHDSATGMFIAIDADCHNNNQALYQFSHEVVHLLEPNRNPPTILLEEGLAVKFSLEAPQYPWSDYPQQARISMPTRAPNYHLALTIAETILRGRPDDLIKNIRQKVSSFANWTPELLVKYGIDQNLADMACRRIPMR